MELNKKIKKKEDKFSLKKKKWSKKLIFVKNVTVTVRTNYHLGKR
jgi:hypothetical protein